MASYLDSGKRYDTPKIHKDLQAQGYLVSEKRVQKLMRELGIQSIIRKKYRPTNSIKSVIKEHPNLLKCDFTAKNLYQKRIL